MGKRLVPATQLPGLKAIPKERVGLAGSRGSGAAAEQATNVLRLENTSKRSTMRFPQIISAFYKVLSRAARGARRRPAREHSAALRRVAVHRTGVIRAAPGETQTILGERAVRQIEQRCHERQTGGGDQKSEANGRVQAAKHFDAFDQRAIGQTTVNALHEPRPSDANRVRIEVRSGDVSEQDALLVVLASQHVDLAQAQWAGAVVKDFDLERR